MSKGNFLDGISQNYRDVMVHYSEAIMQEAYEYMLDGMSPSEALYKAVQHFLFFLEEEMRKEAYIEEQQRRLYYG